MTVTLRNAIAVFGILVAAFLGFGAVQELVVRGIQGGEVQPLIVGVTGTVVSLLLALAALALGRRQQRARPLAIVAAIAAILFHVYAALPPHRYVGLLVLVIAAAYSATLLGIALGHRTDPRPEEIVRRG
ncbi:MAG TPA: hypothetical protein VJ650_16470 [Gemmatimonadaceae bacterium]|nr:hypothetical protein [Gemmatimonadaceae bacterium]